MDEVARHRLRRGIRSRKILVLAIACIVLILACSPSQHLSGYPWICDSRSCVFAVAGLNSICAALSFVPSLFPVGASLLLIGHLSECLIPVVLCLVDAHRFDFSAEGVLLFLTGIVVLTSISALIELRPIMFCRDSLGHPHYNGTSLLNQQFFAPDLEDKDK